MSDQKKYDSTSRVSRVREQNTHFIFVTGGVCSSIGKGVLVASLGTLLKNAGYTVSVAKMDPYLNVDPGTMSPLVHGEVFVTNDGAETDLDLGHYERMLGVHLTAASSVSSGQVFEEILKGEREGAFLGRCIQLVPHVVDAIKCRVLDGALIAKADFVLIEIGGTVGDMEGDVFLEALRQLRLELGSTYVMHAHLSYVPYLQWAGEVKTKPTQHSVMLLKKAGISPDALFLRVDEKMNMKPVKKVAVLSGVDQDFIFQVPTSRPIYSLFFDLRAQGVHTKIQKRFKCAELRDSDLSRWRDLVAVIEKKKPVFRVGVVVKYMGNNDPYISVLEAVKSAAWHGGYDVEITLIAADELVTSGTDARRALALVDGVIVPGGFDSRGFEGKVHAATYARENDVPYLGICLGMQVLLIEYARSVVGLANATSVEIDAKAHQPIIALLEGQKGVTRRGASMRLGLFPCTLKEGTRAYEAYGTGHIKERHRHRYEFNNAYRQQLEQAGIVFSGIYEKEDLVEIAEVKEHSFMLGVQFHPEFLSTPLQAHPLFIAFTKACIGKVMSSS